MVAPTSDHEETLGELLASRARKASETRLAGDAIAALLTGIVICFWRGPAWDLRVSAAVCFFAFALWGLADRDLHRAAYVARPMAAFLKLTRVAAATCGFAAAAYFMLAL